MSNPLKLKYIIDSEECDLIHDMKGMKVFKAKDEGIIFLVDGEGIVISSIEARNNVPLYYNVEKSK